MSTPWPKRLVIVCPMFPPDKGGLPDHTLGLAESFHYYCARASDTGRVGGPVVDIVTRKGPVDESHSLMRKGLIRVHNLVDQWSDPAMTLKALDQVLDLRGDDLPQSVLILWQYVPHMYGRAGVNLKVPNFLRFTRELISERGRSGIHLIQVLLAHEITASFGLNPRLASIALAHRFQWKGLIKAADRIGVSTEAWIDRWIPRSVRERKSVFLAPSPSAIPVVPLQFSTKEHSRNWKNEHGLDPEAPVILFFGSLGGPKQIDWVVESWRLSRKRVNPRTALVVVGGRPELNVSRAEAKDFCPSGYLSAKEVSLALQAAELISLPFIDGVSERRTSFMAGISHGKVVATTIGPSSGPSLRQGNYFLSADAESKDDFVSVSVESLLNPALSIQMAKAARETYRKEMDWPIVWERLLQSGKLDPDGQG